MFTDLFRIVDLGVFLDQAYGWTSASTWDVTSRGPVEHFFAAFPMKLRGGSAGWVRPVAMVPERHFEQDGAA